VKFFIIRLLLPISLLLVMCGCAEERTQAAADARSGLHAAKTAVESGHSTADVVGILGGVDAYLPAASGVNSADWPAPKMSPTEIVTDPRKYAASAPPEPARGWFWAAASGAGLAALGLLRVVLPLIGGGPIVKVAADLVWGIMAHKDQKAADKAADRVQSAVAIAAPLIDQIRSIPADQLPDGIRGILSSPSVQLALTHLATPPSKE
jgi:hypothetical protein